MPIVGFAYMHSTCSRENQTIEQGHAFWQEQVGKKMDSSSHVKISDAVMCGIAVHCFMDLLVSHYVLQLDAAVDSSDTWYFPDARTRNIGMSELKYYSAGTKVPLLSSVLLITQSDLSTHNACKWFSFTAILWNRGVTEGCLWFLQTDDAHSLILRSGGDAWRPRVWGSCQHLRPRVVHLKM